MEDALYDMESLRRFAGFPDVTAALPDETTILNFRHLLEQHDLPARLLERGQRAAEGQRVAGVARDDG
jgi:IS5 family transposase